MPRRAPFGSFVARRTGRSHAEKDCKPDVALKNGNDVHMADSLDVRVVTFVVDDRVHIGRRLFIRPEHVVGPGDGGAMTSFGTSFGCEKVIFAIVLMDMAAFDGT